MVPIPDGGAAMPGGGLGNLIGMLGGGATATTCQPLPANDQLGAHVAGAACSSDTDCMGGSCSTSMGGGGLPGAAAISYPGGYCSGLCLTSDNCGAGGVCSPPMGGAGAGNCFKSCASDSDCTRDGYRCRDLGSGLKGCNPAPKPLPDHVVGKACSNDDACGAGMGTCVTVLPGASAMTGGFFGGAAATPDPAPGGYCSNQCASDADCGAGGVCVGASMGGFTGTQVGTCFKGCSTSDDCRRDYGCELRGGAAALGGGAGTRTNVCVPIGGADAGD